MSDLTAMKILRDAGVSQEQAEASVEAMAEMLDARGTATQHDIRRLEGLIERMIAVFTVRMVAIVAGLLSIYGVLSAALH